MDDGGLLRDPMTMNDDSKPLWRKFVGLFFFLAGEGDGDGDSSPGVVMIGPRRVKVKR